jgi:hypothetical protein
MWGTVGLCSEAAEVVIAGKMMLPSRKAHG